VSRVVLFAPERLEPGKLTIMLGVTHRSARTQRTAESYLTAHSGCIEVRHTRLR